MDPRRPQAPDFLRAFWEGFLSVLQPFTEIQALEEIVSAREFTDADRLNMDQGAIASDWRTVIKEQV